MYGNTCRGVNAAVSKARWFCDWNQRGYINVSIHNSSYYYLENVFLGRQQSVAKVGFLVRIC